MKNFTKSLLISVVALFCVFNVVSAITVAPGDTLWKIAQSTKLSLSALLQLNPQIENPDLIYPGQEVNTGLLGGGGGLPITDYESTLSRPLTSSDTTIYVASVKTTDGHTITSADFAPAIYFMLDPNNDAKKEIVKCTGVSSTTFTGCTRGLAFYGATETAVSANQKSHSAGVQIVNSNVHYYYNTLNTEQSWTAVQQFDVYPVASSSIGYATTTWQFITKGQADTLVNQGAATSTYTVGGINRLGTQIEMASSTYDVLDPTVISTRYSTSTPSPTAADRALFVPISKNSGYIDNAWLDPSQAMTFYTLTGTSLYWSAAIGNLATTTRLVVGNGTIPSSASTTAGLIITNPATSTSSFYSDEYCDSSGCSTGINGLMYASSTNMSITGTATTTIAQFTIPANALINTNQIVGEIPCFLTGENDSFFNVEISIDSTVVGAAYYNRYLNATGTISIIVGAKNSSSAQSTSILLPIDSSYNKVWPYAGFGESTVDMTSSRTFYVKVKLSDTDVRFRYYNSLFEMKQYK